MKTLAVTAMAGAQTINNRLEAATVTVTMTATAMTMKTKEMAAAAEVRQQCGGGSQLGGGSLVRPRWGAAWQWRRQLGKSAALAAAASLATEAAAWREQDNGDGMMARSLAKK